MWGKNVWSIDMKTQNHGNCLRKVTKIKAVIHLFLISGKITTSIDLDLTELIHHDKGNVAA